MTPADLPAIRARAEKLKGICICLHVGSMREYDEDATVRDIAADDLKALCDELERVRREAAEMWPDAHQHDGQRWVTPEGMCLKCRAMNPYRIAP